MQLTVRVVCLFLALVCFVLAAFGVSAKVGWRDAGFAFVTAAILFG